MPCPTVRRYEASSSDASSPAPCRPSGDQPTLRTAGTSTRCPPRAAMTAEVEEGEGRAHTAETSWYLGAEVGHRVPNDRVSRNSALRRRSPGRRAARLRTPELGHSGRSAPRGADRHLDDASGAVGASVRGRAFADMPAPALSDGASDPILSVLRRGQRTRQRNLDPPLLNCRAHLTPPVPGQELAGFYPVLQCPSQAAARERYHA